MTILILALFLGWILLGLVGGGWIYAYFQRRFLLIAEQHRRQDLNLAIFFSVIGGLNCLMVAFFLSGFGKYGWWIWPKKK